MDLLYIVFLAVAISLDGFFVGVTYGIRKVKVPFISLCIISTVSALVIALSMALGSTILEWISPGLAALVGALILILIGLFVIRETYKTLALRSVKDDVNEGYSITFADTHDTKTTPQPAHGAEASELELKEMFTLKIKPLGIIVQIFKEPLKADFDASGTISYYEAVFLGLALAMDAFGAGFGAALTGFSPLLIPLACGITKFIFVSTGNMLGAQHSGWLNKKTAYIPGLILIFLGVMKLF